MPTITAPFLRLIVCVLLPGLALFPAVAAAEYLQALQQRAQALDLAHTRAWQSLLHYQGDWFGGGVTSTVITDWFFVSSEGRRHPRVELDATLAAFSDGAEIGPRKLPAQCLFRGRFAFLRKKLDFDPQRMPLLDCRKFQRWRARIDARRVGLVFPTAYPNSPASMFGHTLLRIDSGGHAGELLSYAVNFAAQTDEDSGLAFAFKGLFGGYAGAYGLFPYYDKVKEYAWIESRDIWDYRLQLSARQRNRLMAHLWALQGVHFTYYFLSRNCSYQLLALLQAAMPKLQLVEQFDLYALPADTIRALAAVPGLLGHAGYRPALATTLASHARTMSQQALAIAIALARGQAEPDGRRVQTLPPQTRARVLELAHDYLYYRHLGGAYSAELTRTRAGAILLARSRITTHANWPQVPAPDTPPHAGHESRRIALTSAWGATGFHLGVDFRLAYHGLLDPPGGYVGGAGVKLFDIALRLDPNAQGHALQLAHLTLIDLVSISPRGPFFKPLSWRLSTGLRQRPIAAPFHPDAHLGFYLQGGPGLAWGSLDTITWYSFALLSADLNHGFDQGYAVAGGASAGLLAYPLAGWQIKAEAGLLENAIGDDGHRAWLRLAQQWPLIGAWQLRLGLGWYGTARDDHARAALGLATYF